jgi:cysteinyl-tRNA synthetase
MNPAPKLKLYNTLTRRKEDFTPINPANIRMYVCGPTVYDRPHLGNARSVVVYDVLYRLLKTLYGEKHVTYVRNITDVDDKINAAAKANHEPISALTRRVENWFHDDMAALNVLPATCDITGTETQEQVTGCMGEPHATRHIPHMIALIENLIKNGNAYVAQGHVLFAVNSYKEYGALSGRKLDELVAGARIEVESYKKHPGDFVLWKPAGDGDDASSVFESPWGRGRPGWHIECSAMSTTYLGAHFDIHGGGADLMFPHHENEIAQSRCALPGSQFANVWVHNGFLTVGGEKMSKSLGNFTTVRDLLDKGIKGEVIRFALLSAKYNEPLDWNEKLVHDAKVTLDKWYRLARPTNETPSKFMNAFRDALCDDMNLPKAFSFMHNAQAQELYTMGRMLGLFGMSAEEWFKGAGGDDTIVSLIDARIAAKKAKNWPEADRIRKELADQGIMLEDRPDGSTDWRRA